MFQPLVLPILLSLFLPFHFSKSHKVFFFSFSFQRRSDDLFGGFAAGSPLLPFDGVFSSSFVPQSIVISALLNKSAGNVFIQNFMRSVLTGRDADPGVWCLTWLPFLLSLHLFHNYTLRIPLHPPLLLGLMLIQRLTPPTTTTTTCMQPPPPTPCLLPFPVFLPVSLSGWECTSPSKLFTSPVPAPL